MRPNAQARRLAAELICELVVIGRDGTDPTVIYDSAALIEAPNWTPDGQWLIYNADGRLWRLRRDGAKGPTRIDSRPVENLNNDHVISPDGRQIYATSNDGHIYVLPICGGVPRRITNDSGMRHYLHGVSPDGATLVYVGLTRDGASVMTRICTIPGNGGADAILTDGACPVDGPEFSPDGAWIWFNSEAAATRPGHAQIFRVRPNGRGLQQVTLDDRVNWFPHPSPDGRTIAYLSYPLGTIGHPADKAVILRTMDPDGGNPRDLDAFNGGQGTINVASWSPDSQWLAYVRYPAAR
jgi:Tol biopolymer transport system component